MAMNSGDLYDALKSNQAEIHLPAGDYVLRSPRNTVPCVITCDPGARFTEIRVYHHHIPLDIVGAELAGSINIGDCDGFRFIKCAMNGGGSLDFPFGHPDSVGGMQGPRFNATRNCAVIDCEFDRVLFGVTSSSDIGLHIIGNLFTRWQGDAVRCNAPTDLLIEGNTGRGPVGAYHSGIHSDFIQLSARGAGIVGGNIEIARNTLDTAGQTVVQGIFCKVEDKGALGRSSGLYIHDNTIRSGTIWGIHADGFDNLRIEGNTVTRDPDAKFYPSLTGDTQNWTPKIWARDSTGTWAGNHADGGTGTDQGAAMTETSDPLSVALLHVTKLTIERDALQAKIDAARAALE